MWDKRNFTKKGEKIEEFVYGLWVEESIAVHGACCNVDDHANADKRT